MFKSRRWRQVDHHLVSGTEQIPNDRGRKTTQNDGEKSESIVACVSQVEHLWSQPPGRAWDLGAERTCAHSLGGSQGSTEKEISLYDEIPTLAVV